MMANLERNRRFSASSPLSRPAPTPAHEPSPRIPTSLHPGLPLSYKGASPRRSITGRVFRKHALHRITEEHKQEIRMAFELFDSRKVGKMNYRELKAAMRALEFDVKKGEVKMLLEKFSKDSGDEVNYEEFLEIMVHKFKDKDPNEDVMKAFRYFDEDSTGKISLKNLRKISKELGEHITDEELITMIDEFDKDSDGEISMTEFFEIMKTRDKEDDPSY
ncbi:hypothetical protein M758_10G168700 [Ceratodon purpureus]|uniref:EF-hand domain-containing protein n=1 Tax=Ceratodon purpureus TaxID=3225 RepID=A0A8T0GTQ8_CERPU|nr:hypothetical protein KC19_10G173100 [Ceratodon purpureus]KAG0604390.1 hypothetical protein M758_10G168700 [Ceratodon purpureus]